jgi:methyl-accepting chemotaxis protein
VVTIKNKSASLFDNGNELASNMIQTAAAVNQVNTISDQNTHIIDSLVKEVSRFKVE